jgi:NDP-sugar pyrophosphorylase family protein
MIMAAGLGTRLRPLTGLIPKPMTPILNRPALYHILRLLHRHGITDVVVNLHHFPDTITTYFGDGGWLGMSIAYAYEEELLGTAGGVKNNEAFLSGSTFLVLSGDSLTDLDLDALLATHRAKGGIATLAVKEVDDPSQYGVVVLDKDDRVLGFQEKPAREEARSNLCNCGIYVFESAIFERIPARRFYDFGNQVYPGLLADGAPFFAHRVAEYWNDVGNLEEYRRGNFDALFGRVRVEHPGVETQPQVWVGTRTYVDPTARLVPPVLVGKQCRIEAEAVLEGPLIIGDHSIIERGAHVRGGIAWSGALLGEESTVIGGIIGRGAHLRANVRVEGGVVGERCVVGEGSDLGSALVDPNTIVEQGTTLAS